MAEVESVKGISTVLSAIMLLNPLTAVWGAIGTGIGGADLITDITTKELENS